MIEGRWPAAKRRRRRPTPRRPARGARPRLCQSPAGYRSGLMAATGPGAGYVGREAELERLERRAQDAIDGRGGFVVVRGESGMGATRTAHEIAARADRLGMVTLW